MADFSSRFGLEYKEEAALRYIGDTQVAIHCHHYNARILATIEGAASIDGFRIVADSASAAFGSMLGKLRRPGETAGEIVALSASLYGHLGFGTLSLAELSEGKASQSSSHLVEGWRAGFPALRKKMCAFTCGYLEAVSSVALGREAEVRETACMLEGAAACQFELRDSSRSGTQPTQAADPCRLAASTNAGQDLASNADSQHILREMLALPIVGDASGLIPAFNVYLASMPVDFYNLASIRYVEEMSKSGHAEFAVRLLRHDAETCALNTFRGILRSQEWEAIVGNSLTCSLDTLVALAAVCRVLGWGNYRIAQHERGESMEMLVAGGYEAEGFLEHRGRAEVPVCPMVTGVAAGLMELVDGEGPIIERMGQYTADESECLACGKVHCRFEVRRSA